MVDSVKQYNLAGVASEVELGKKGSKIDGTNADQVSLKTTAGALAHAEIANGTIATHAVTLAQLEDANSGLIKTETVTVSYSDTVVELLTIPAGGRVLEVSVTTGAGNWSGATSTTEITIGDSADNSRVFSGWTPGDQIGSDADVTYAEETVINAYVAAGGASTGTAKISIMYADG